MAKDLLTREELNLLLSDDPISENRSPGSPESATEPLFSPADFSTLQQVLETYLCPGVTAWSVLFNRSIQLTLPEISLVHPGVLHQTGSAVVAQVEFFQGLKGLARFVMPAAEARVLAGMALGTQEPPKQFDAIHRSSFSSILKYLLAEMRTLIMRGTGKRTGTSEPEVMLWPDEAELPAENLVQARIPWTVDGEPQEPLLFWADRPLTSSLLALQPPRRQPPPEISLSTLKPRGEPRSEPAARARGGGRGAG
jgi:hypothetical protein